MTTITFDTLKFVERLTRAGVPEAHAKAEAEALSEVFAAGTEELSTKGDLRELELRIAARFEQQNGRLNLIQWMLAAVVIAEVMPLLKQLFS